MFSRARGFGRGGWRVLLCCISPRENLRVVGPLRGGHIFSGAGPAANRTGRGGEPRRAGAARGHEGGSARLGRFRDEFPAKGQVFGGKFVPPLFEAGPARQHPRLLQGYSVSGLEGDAKSGREGPAGRGKKKGAFSDGQDGQGDGGQGRCRGHQSEWAHFVPWAGTTRWGGTASGAPNTNGREGPGGGDNGQQLTRAPFLERGQGWAGEAGEYRARGAGPGGVVVFISRRTLGS